MPEEFAYPESCLSSALGRKTECARELSLVPGSENLKAIIRVETKVGEKTLSKDYPIYIIGMGLEGGGGCALIPERRIGNQYGGWRLW